MIKTHYCLPPTPTLFSGYSSMLFIPFLHSFKVSYFMSNCLFDNGKRTQKRDKKTNLFILYAILRIYRSMQDGWLYRKFLISSIPNISFSSQVIVSFYDKTKSAHMHIIARLLRQSIKKNRQYVKKKRKKRWYQLMWQLTDWCHILFFLIVWFWFLRPPLF